MPEFLKPERRAIEERLLAHFFPSFRLTCGTAIGSLETNSHTHYNVAIELHHFPLESPTVKIVSPRLQDKSGILLAQSRASLRMHHLGPDPYGAIQLCLHVPGTHDPRDTLYKSLLKARLWLEAYETHLRTGTMIDELLSHGNYK
jgi:hypothetical protein